jgi:hypothetical protein
MYNRLKYIIAIFFLLTGVARLHAQTNTSSPGRIVLPLADPLVMNNGSKVTNAKQWLKRRNEIIQLFTAEEYGRSPARPKDMTFKVFDIDKNALSGKAIRKQVTVYFNGQPDGPQMDILIYLPKQVKKSVPVILQLNFGGNHTLNNDTIIKITKSWVGNGKGVVNNKATEASRGNSPNKDVELILSRGYGFATIYCGDIAPDYDGQFKNGVHALYPELQGRGDNFSTIAAWAWGLSRALDYMETDKEIDAGKVAVFGFSRLGKAAVWAGATDQRFAMVISNQSGAGGVKLFHSGRGETIRHLCTAFPHWFCGNFKKYMDKDTLLPFDQHMLIALIAPRPICIGSAEGDKNSDPEGEFYGAVYADPVYRLLGVQGLSSNKMPGLNEPVAGGRIQYHIRPGNHSIITYDWEQYLNFMDKQFKQ